MFGQITGLKEQELSPEELKFMEEQEESVEENLPGTITPEIRRNIMASIQDDLYELKRRATPPPPSSFKPERSVTIRGPPSPLMRSQSMAQIPE
jgi:hypothetical protein